MEPLMLKGGATIGLLAALAALAACDRSNVGDEPLEGGGAYPEPATTPAASIPATDPAVSATQNEAANLVPTEAATTAP